MIRRGVRVNFPKNLTIGDNCWIGEDVRLINHAPIIISDNVCISQESIICSSGHDFKSISLAYKHKEIRIESGAWICFAVNIIPGARIGSNSVISAGETFSGELPDNTLFTKGNTKKFEITNQ